MEAQQRNETVTVYHAQTTPVQQTRTVMQCVPYQENVTVTRMVPQYVQQVVPTGCGGWARS